MLRIFVILLFSVVVFIGLGAALLDARYGGGDAFPDRSSDPMLSEDALQLVADIEFPPGNIASSQNGRIFFTFHPEGRPDYNIAELVDGKAQPIAFESDTPLELETVLSLRIDQQNRLWLLDYANHGTGQPKIVAIDLDSMKVVHQHNFSSEIVGLGSHLNDFQVDTKGQFIYIADASIFGKDPAVIVYDIQNKTARRAIEDHDSVLADNYIPVVEGEKMLMLGFFAVRPGVDSIALDRRNEWLYFAPVSDDYMHRVRVSDLHNPELGTEELHARIEPFALKTMSDGITTDNEGNIYISDLEHSAIVQMNSKGELKTLYKNTKLRWPDGFSFGPNGDLYVTASSLQDVMLKPASYIAQKGPYQIFKLNTGATATPGH
jgi:sugar lactone lactonase YvrE